VPSPRWRESAPAGRRGATPGAMAGNSCRSQPDTHQSAKSMLIHTFMRKTGKSKKGRWRPDLFLPLFYLWPWRRPAPEEAALLGHAGRQAIEGGRNDREIDASPQGSDIGPSVNSRIARFSAPRPPPALHGREPGSRGGGVASPPGGLPVPARPARAPCAAPFSSPSPRSSRQCSVAIRRRRE